MSDDNPYERYDLDPTKGPSALTERMRELIEEATDEESRRALRAAWEELTLHPERRFRAAVGAHPDSHGPLGAPPPRTPARPAPPVEELSLHDLTLRPSVSEALGLPPGAGTSLPELPFDRDPILGSGEPPST